ncbi:hypothetical protein ACUNE3_22455, partial [Serratia sp. IR-2025]
PSRHVNSDFIYEVENKTKTLSKINKIKLIIKTLAPEPLSIKKLSRLLGLSQYEIRYILKNLKEIGWVDLNEELFTLTGLGHVEVGIEAKGLNFIASNPDFYYPRKW